MNKRDEVHNAMKQKFDLALFECTVDNIKFNRFIHAFINTSYSMCLNIIIY